MDTNTGSPLIANDAIATKEMNPDALAIVDGPWYASNFAHGTVMGAAAPAAFRTAAARHRKSLIYIVPWATGARTSIGLNNVGYLNELQIEANLVITVTGAGGTVTDIAQAQSNYFPSIGLRSPAGEQIWYWSSREIFDFNYRYQRGLFPANDPSYATWIPANAGAQSVVLRLRLPVALNDGSGFDLGMLMRQVSNNQFFLDLQFAAITDLVGSGTAVIASITGQVTVEEIFYDAVLANANVQPPDFSHFIRMRGIQSGALLNGQNVLQYAVGPVITDAFLRFMNNGAADAVINNVTSVQLQSDSSTEIDFRSGRRLAYDNTMHLGKALRAGVYQEDFCDDMDSVNATRGRDFINSNLAAQLQWNIIYAGAPTGTSFIQQTYREIIGLSS